MSLECSSLDGILVWWYKVQRMDGFGDSFVPPTEGGTEVDPAAEFLAREQDQLAGLDDDIVPTTEAVNAEESQPPQPDLNGEADPFGGAPPAPDLDSFEMLGGDEMPQGAQAEAPPAEAAVPVADAVPDYSGFGGEFGGASEDAVDSGGDAILGETAPVSTSPIPPVARSPVPPVVREEPEKIKLWREQQRVRLEEKDEAEEVNKDSLMERAKKELEDWYKQHEEQVAKTRQANRSAEKELVADTCKMEPGTEWERIAKLCNFNPKTSKSSRDISRMRSIILQVKQNPPVKA
ncbi:hypothetical protein Pmani_014027 [Petrolisthes manimaculis]|uniref:Clathrin light chain n=1 Tax=Petrolisthes manimaculis TaxID=1843537 RepID=A0AAE1UDI0_9EUCA|nr:hypothetical protein Pmani_014027 [Petrolisthes manimaculis]